MLRQAKIYSDVHKMSCVCIALFACQHAFQTREPLPQFLPSARHAFEVLETSMNESLGLAHEQHRDAFGISLVYSFAEQEVVKELVVSLEELLELSGRLFGTRAWLLPGSEWERVETGVSDVDQGWYSTWKQEV